MFFIISCIFILIFALANVFIYKALFMKIPFFQAHKKILISFFILVFVMQLSFLLFRFSDTLNNTFYAVLAHSFAFTYCFFFLTLLLQFCKFLIKISLKKNKKIIFDSSRRQSLKLIFNISVLIFGLGLMLRTWGNANKIPDIKKLTLHLKALKENVNLVMITDVHLGKNLHEEFLQGLVDKINTLNADIIVIVGDLIDTKPKELEHYISKLNDLQSKLGVYYVLGNHEYYRGLDEVLRVLRTKTKLHILINESLDLGAFNLAGLADLAGLRLAKAQNSAQFADFIPDVEKTKAKLNPHKPSILLTHQPKSVKEYDLSDYELILSGHTHAGQVFPFGALVLAQQGFLYGLYELNQKSKLYVSSGAGFWGPALRFLAPSEIVHIELKGEK